MSFWKWKLPKRPLHTKFQVLPHPEMNFETSNFIGWALKQEPIRDYLSYVFGIYRWLWLNVVYMGKYWPFKGIFMLKLYNVWQ